MLLSGLCKGHSQGFVLALRALGLLAAGQGKSGVPAVTDSQREYSRKKEGKKNTVMVCLEKGLLFNYCKLLNLIFLYAFNFNFFLAQNS